MGFLKNLFMNREIGKVEELIRTSPAPSLFVRLAQLYREAGDPIKAKAIERKGAEMFPESEALSQALADAEKSKRDAEIRRLESRLEQYPSPVLHARLGDLYVKDNKFEKAQKTVNAGLRSYPDYGGLYCVLAKVAHAKGEDDEELEHLVKACTLDKYNYDALMQLANAYLKRGDAEASRETIQRILFFAPKDVKALRFLETFDERLAEAQKEAALPKGDASRIAAGAAAAAEKVKTESSEKAKKGSGVGTSLHVEIHEIRRVQGVTGTLLIDSYGLVIASDLPEDLDEELAAAMITNICRIARDSGAGMQIGAFEDGILETEETALHVIQVGEMIMGVFASPETKAGLLQRAIHSFAEKAIESYH